MKRLTAAIIAFFLIPHSASHAQTYSFDFEADMQGWQSDFADYPDGDSMLYGLNWYHTALPSPVMPVQNGIFMEGNNFSDDLFFFIKKQITGLNPLTTYEVVLSVDAATNESIYMIGGSDLMMKAGVTLAEPQKVVDSSAMVRMNIDKGNQWSPGTDMDTIGVGRHSWNDTLYHLFTLDNSNHPFPFTTDATGSAWLIAGAESAFESYAKIYFAAVNAVFTATTSIAEETASTVKIFPNPSGSCIAVMGNVIKEVIIYNLTGEKIISISGTEAIDVSFLPDGVYVAEVHDSQGIYMQKLIKN